MSYKLTFFDAKGRGEVSRLLFVLKRQKYEDYRIKPDTWPTEKAKSKFGWLPNITFGGKTYADAMGIARFLAREFGLGGKTNVEMLEIDQVCGVWQDVFNTFVRFFFEKDEKLKEKYKTEAYEELYPKYLRAYEKILTENGTGYYVGKQITLADVAAMDCLGTCVEDSLVCKYPKVTANRKLVLSNDKIKAYHDSCKK